LDILHLIKVHKKALCNLLDLVPNLQKHSNLSHYLTYQNYCNLRRFRKYIVNNLFYLLICIFIHHRAHFNIDAFQEKILKYA